jgi:hypothetical protein
MMWIIVFSHFLIAATLAVLAVRHAMSPLVACVYLAIPGFMSSLLSALPESLVAAGLIAGYMCWERRQIGAAAICLGAALLVRETIVVFVLAAIVVDFTQGRRRHAAVIAAALIPAGVWRLFVGVRLFADWGWQGFVATPADLGVPFAGLAALVRAAVARLQPAPEILPALIFPLVLAFAAVLAVWLLVERRGPLELAAAAYAAVAVSLGYDKIWSHLPSGERGTFELFLCLLLLLITAADRPLALRRALTMMFVVLGVYTLAFAPDAATSRAALLLIR